MIDQIAVGEVRRATAREAQRIRQMRNGANLGGLKSKDLINEGRQ